MGDWPQNAVMPLTLTSFNRRCLGIARAQSGVDPGTASATWPNANVTLYLPFTLEGMFPVTKAFWVNGTVVSGNCALAIYKMTPLANQQCSTVFTTGTTAQAGTSAIQKVTLGTPVLLTPGVYFFGFGCDNVTATFARNAVSNAQMRAAGACAQGTYPPPALSSQATIAQSYWPLVGISNDPLL